MNALYCATKFALEGLSESLRHELATHGVQVALVEPGGYRTAFARNMVWGERPLPAGGRDARQLAAYRRMQEKLLARPGRDPAAVVRAVLELCEMDTMPMRTRVGTDARSASFVRRWLPQKAGVGAGRRAVPPQAGRRAANDVRQRARRRVAARRGPARPGATRPPRRRTARGRCGMRRSSASTGSRGSGTPTPRSGSAFSTTARGDSSRSHGASSVAASSTARA